MTYEEEPPQDTKIHKLIIEDSYKEQAIADLKKMVEGNKYDPEDVKLLNFEGETLQFQAENMLTILTKVTHKRVPGRLGNVEKAESEFAARDVLNRAYLTLHTDVAMERKIRDVVLERDDKGFGIDNNILKLPFWSKQCVVHEPCHTCQTTGSVKCLPCSGKGQIVCPRCNGSGMGHCVQCNGGQMVPGPNNQKIQCPTCHGRGRTSCTSCNQVGTIRCSTCKSLGTTQCPNCKGNAWNSVIYTMQIEARTAFDYPKDRLPEKVVAMIEKYGAKIREHAEIKISQASESVVNVEDEEKAKQHADADRKKDLRIPVIYEVFLPYGHIEYEIAGKSYYTFLFGTKGRLIHVSPFIDDLIKNGMRKLSDAAELRGDVAANIQQAAEYRTIKEGIAYTAKHSLRRAKKMLKQTNRIGLSTKTLEKIISDTDIALKNITKKPRMIGLVISTLLNLGLFAGYFLSPLRQMIVSKIANVQVHILVDLLILGAVSFIGITVIQMISQTAIKKVMQTIGIQQIGTPKLGNILYWAIGLSCVSFIGVLEAAKTLNASVPLWYANLL